MDRLGPFDTPPHLAVAVSGGADSMALALLAQAWTAQRQGGVTALIVDHGLRADSNEEARLTHDRLARLGISARILPLAGLARGPALAERARRARYDVLMAACQSLGCRDLLLGHHAGDQVETLAMRALRGSRDHGLAGMSARRESRGIRLLRPLLSVHPMRLRDDLTRRGITWVEDPSNRDPRALRTRLRIGLAGAGWDSLLSAAIVAGARRVRDETLAAEALARSADVHPEGFALLKADHLLPAALSQLLTAIGGAAYPPDPDLVAGLAAELAPATLHGVRVMRTGRLGGGWLLAREEAAIGSPVSAASQMVRWDNRFAISCQSAWPGDAWIDRLGDDAARFRTCSRLPSAVLRTLPVLRIGKTLAAVPHLGYEGGKHPLKMTVNFAPLNPVQGPVFLPPLPDFLGWREPAGVGMDVSLGRDLPRHGEPSTRVGMQARLPHTIYQDATPGPRSQTLPRCAIPNEDVSKLI